MTKSFTYPKCHTEISEADAFWDELQASGRCPACSLLRQRRHRLGVIGIAAFSLVIGETGCYSAWLRPWNKNFKFLGQSRSQIHSWLLEQAPLGSSMSDVRALIEKNRWRADFVHANHGFSDQRNVFVSTSAASALHESGENPGDVCAVKFTTSYPSRAFASGESTSVGKDGVVLPCDLDDHVGRVEQSVPVVLPEIDVISKIFGDAPAD